MDNNQKLIKQLRQNQAINEFLKANELNEKDINENLLVFSSYQNKLNKCNGCKCLNDCGQSYEGYQPILKINTSQIVIDYKPCKFLEDLISEKQKRNRLHVYGTNFNQFNFNEVYKSSERQDLLLKVADVYHDYKEHRKTKGLYVYGPYGCGKTYLLAWLAEKLTEMGANVVFAYYPDLVRKIKSSIGDGTLENYLEELKNVEVLMLDDIGGEQNSDFIRDEVLGAILQNRMCNQSLTFMTSNLDPKLLLSHLSSGSRDVDLVKGSRVFERISTLMTFIPLKDKNYRQ